MVVAVDVVLVGAAVELHALQELLLDVRRAGGGGEGREPVLVRDDAVERRAGREVAGPAHEARDAVGAFPVRVLLAAERRGAGVGPGVVVRAVVGGILDDGVVGEAEVVDQLEQLADLHVVLDHAVAVFVLPGDAAVLRLHVGAEVHARGVPPAEEGLARLGLPRDELLGGGGHFVIDGLHALLGERAGVLDGLAALAVGLALEHAARAEFLPELRVSSGSPRSPAPPSR